MKPVVNGRASICQWELEFYFRNKDQIRRFVKLLMKVDFDFEYEKVTLNMKKSLTLPVNYTILLLRAVGQTT